mgnify:CR=1 FL=1
MGNYLGNRSTAGPAAAAAVVCDRCASDADKGPLKQRAAAASGDQRGCISCLVLEGLIMPTTCRWP